MTFLVQGFAVISGAQVHRRRTGARTKPWSWSRPLTGYTRPVTVKQSYVPRFPDTQPRRSLPLACIARRDIRMNGLKGTSRLPRNIARRTPLTPAVLIVDNFFHDRAGTRQGLGLKFHGEGTRADRIRTTSLN